MNIRYDGSRREGQHSGAEECFDRTMRELHGQALTQVSPQVRARLRAARTAAATERAPMHGWRWVLASGCAAVFALAIGLQWQEQSPASLPTQTAGNEVADDDTDDDVIALATLDESPDLYLWLASNDDTLPVAWER